ncbi:hypothetical protein AC1031_003083 [Aphanomyces cochlioides]|nr:hypothetical protein AC1031_003083 [Aphanomyces cochlioides]
MTQGDNKDQTAIEEHPLQTGWSLWFDKKMPKRTDVSTYQSNLQKIANFATVEDFWRHYIHVKRPSQLPKDTNLYLFRDQPNCAPMWEAFPNGGCWILKIKKKANVLGKMWQDLLFAVIGEAFETLNVVGIAMAIRSKEDMISVWNADNSDDNVRFVIGYVSLIICLLMKCVNVAKNSRRSSCWTRTR